MTSPAEEVHQTFSITHGKNPIVTVPRTSMTGISPVGRSPTAVSSASRAAAADASSSTSWSTYGIPRRVKYALAVAHAEHHDAP